MCRTKMLTKNLDLEVIEIHEARGSRFYGDFCTFMGSDLSNLEE